MIPGPKQLKSILYNSQESTKCVYKFRKILKQSEMIYNPREFKKEC